MPIGYAEADAVCTQFLDAHPGANLKPRIGLTQEDLYGTKASRANLGFNIEAAYSPTRSQVDIALANTHSAEHLRACLRHEIIGHYGLNTFEPAAKRALLEAIAASKDEPSLASAHRVVEKHYSDVGELLKAEEVFSFLAEEADFRKELPKKDFIEVWQQVVVLKQRQMSVGDLAAIVSEVEQGIQLNTRQQRNFPQRDSDLFKIARSADDATHTGERSQQHFSASNQSLFKQQDTRTQGESTMATSSTTPSAGASAAPGAESTGSATVLVKPAKRGLDEKVRQASEALVTGDGSARDPDDAVQNRTEHQERPLHRTKLPSYVHKQFYENGGRYFSVDGSRNGHYFIDEGHRVVLNTKQQVSRTSQIAIDIAKAREWKSIQVSGSQAFRREAWMQASVAGMAVSGYSPSQQDVAELEHRRANIKADPTKVEPEANAVQDATPQEPVQEPQIAPPNSPPASGMSDRQKSAQTAAAAAAVPTYSLAEQSGGKTPPRQLDNAKEAVKQFLATDARKRPHLVETRVDASGKEISRVIGSTTDGPKPSHTLSSDMNELRAQVQSVATAGQSAASKPALSARREHAAQDARSELVASQNNLDAAVAFQEANPKVAAKSHPRLAGPYAVLGAYDAKLKEQGVNEDARKSALSTMRGTLAQHIREGRYDSIKTQQARFPAREAAERVQQQEPSQALSA